ncbi:MAG TPA: KH domain-containing protein [Gaiellaceae bacterium]|nr:KH domain-containing protein [Gaiellaceae bacterium]
MEPAGPLVAELLEYLARKLVDEPDAVRVERVEEDDTIVLRLHVAQDDLGKVIGRQGRIARALRTIVRAGSVRERRRVQLEIVD